MLEIDPYVADVLSEVRVLELSTATKNGKLNTRPMSGNWSPATGQITVTVPVAYPQKVYNVRRDGKVALFYSDFTGSGLTGDRTVLVQGIASAPTDVVAPQDIPEFWREVFRKHPASVDMYCSDEFSTMMDWYLWRLRIVVTPERIHVADAAAAGGAWESRVPDSATMRTRIVDAVERYPTAVLCSRDERGYPFAVRATVTTDGIEPLRVRPRQPFSGRPGPANLLWHRHDGCGGQMRILLISGVLTQRGREWGFAPERMAGEFGAAHDVQSWSRSGRTRAMHYLEERGLRPPKIDWATVVAP